MKYLVNDDDLEDWIKKIEETKYYDIDDSLKYVIEEMKNHIEEEHKKFKNWNEGIELLKKLLPLLNKSSDIHSVNAVYYSPSQQLRMQADRIEYEDRIIQEVCDFLKDK